MSIWLSIKLGNLVNIDRLAKVAFSLTDLVSLTSAQGVRNSKNCNITVKKVDLDNMLLTYNVKCHEKNSDPKGHSVKIRFDANNIVEKSTIKDLDVKVSCSCPYFLYGGSQWNLGQGDALEGEPRPLYQAPTDPRRFQNVICKHVKVVADRVNPFLKRLLNKYKEQAVEKILEHHEPTPFKPEVKVIEEPEDEVVEINKEEPKKPEKEKEPESTEISRTEPVVKSYGTKKK